MTLAEPMTLLTDYLLGGVCAWLGWRLWAAREGHTARRLWAMALGALALAALAGGSYHGFAPMLAPAALAALWRLTVLSIGVASFAMLCGSGAAVTTGTLRRVVLGLAALKLALYSAWMAGHDDFVFVIVDTGTAMAGVAVLHAWSLARSRERASLWMLAAVGVSVLAAAAQASGYALHRHFNHNDLYHVIQVAAMILFYNGAVLLTDRPPGTP